jgi:hypothetical protein
MKCGQIQLCSKHPCTVHFYLYGEIARYYYLEISDITKQLLADITKQGTL